MKALVTGASGFIGSTLVPELRRRGWDVTTAGRTRTVWPDVDSIILDQGYTLNDWKLQGFDVVFHLAGRAHGRSNDLNAMRDSNVEVTRALLSAAVAGGVGRFFYLSTLKVHGEGREGAYQETELPVPVGPYAIAKLEAETLIRSVGIRSVILRPPLVYGPGVRANFLALMGRIQRGKMIPVSRSPNRRSLISVRNLCDAMIRVAVDPAAADEVFLVSDGVDLSTEHLTRLLASHLGATPRIRTVPDFLCTPLMNLFSSPFRQLFGSLTADISHLKGIGWTAPFSVEDELRETALWFRSARS